MGQKFTAKVLNDRQIETVLARLYQQSDRQLSSLLLHYLPQLPNLLLGKGIIWDRSKINFYRDKYIPIEPQQGEFIYSIARAINAKISLNLAHPTVFPQFIWQQPLEITVAVK